MAYSVKIIFFLQGSNSKRTLLEKNITYLLVLYLISELSPRLSTHPNRSRSHISSSHFPIVNRSMFRHPLYFNISSLLNQEEELPCIITPVTDNFTHVSHDRFMRPPHTIFILQLLENMLFSGDRLLTSKKMKHRAYLQQNIIKQRKK